MQVLSLGREDPLEEEMAIHWSLEHWQPVFLPGKSHGQRSLVGYSPWGCREVQFSSVAQSCMTLCNPMNHSTPGHPVHHNSQSAPKLMSIELVMPSNHLILCHPLFLWPSAFFIVQLSHPYMATGKTIALTRQTFVGKVMPLFFNTLSRLQRGRYNLVTKPHEDEMRTLTAWCRINA